MKKILYSILAFMLPGLAYADSGGPFSPVADDVSVKVINQIFGGLVNGGNDAFGGAITTFNGAILIIGGILATYTLLAGTLGTAHDGEMLGKKFSSVWIPIRYALGTSLVLPVLSGGYCIMQQLVMWCVLQGIGLADMVWESYMKTPGIAANITPSVSMKKSALKLAEDTYLLTACVQANQKAVDLSDEVLKYADKYKYGWSLSADGKQWIFGDGKAVFSSGDTQCGNIKFADPIANSTPTKDTTKTDNLGYLGPLDNLFAPTDVSAINEAHKTATAALIRSMATLSAATIEVGNYDGPIAEQNHALIENAANAYVFQVQAAAKGVANSPSDSSKTAKQYGWFLAGAYFMNTVVTNNRITNAIAAVPSSSYKESYVSDSAKGILNWASKVVDHVQERGVGTNLMDGVIQAATTVDLYELKNDARHPVIIINEIGDRLQTIWMIVMGVLAAAAGVGMLASATALGKVATFAAKFTGTADKVLVVVALLALPILALAGMAFTAKYLIPMLPFMMWLGILGGWLIAVVIAVIAAPLWAIMHLHPNGDDLTGKGGNGYMLVLGLLLRPVLAIFGFIAAITISSVMGEFINKVYFQVFAFSQGDGNGIGWFFGMIAGAAIYIAIMFSFVKKSFSLMHVIPDELMKWIGGGGDQLGHYAGKMGEGSTGGVAQVAAFTAGRGLGPGLQNAGRQIGDINKQQKSLKEGIEAKAVEGAKAFNGTSAELDKKFGAGQGERITSMLGITDKNSLSHDSQKKLGEFTRGAALAREHGGEEGQTAFIEAMEQSASNGFSQHGGASEAAQFLSQNIASNAVLAQAESKFGSKGVEQLRSMAPHKSGNPNLLDLNKAENAIAALGSQFKASQPAQTEQPIDEVAELVKDTPFFNPANGEVERVEQQQQVSFNFDPESVQPSVLQNDIPSQSIRSDEQKE
jgi:hypothetical protein